MSYLDRLQKLKSPAYPSVESVETPSKQGLDTLDTSLSGHSQNLSDAANDSQPVKTSRKKLKSPVWATVETIESPSKPGLAGLAGLDGFPNGHSQKSREGLDTLDTTPKGLSGNFKAANDAAPLTETTRRAFLVTQPDGTVLSVTRCPPATLAEIQADYPGCAVNPELDRPPAPALSGEPLKIAQALLRHWGEDDPVTVAEYLDGLARSPERLEQAMNEALRLGLAVAVADPPRPSPASPSKAVCARCQHFERDTINPTGGLGGCLIAAPASRQPGSCWPWPHAEIRCTRFEEHSDE
ncbi:hypothetical protein [uncultured Thiocystis sp.]|jgi:hypothetical protein|uniref:hypothetical protein n=1 Tax=uncultured Thiocystis sp. TaxID=1202134 RepID=UPI0025DE4D09|nr:hypothetical protein [uncultured Thiocystis sp.]